MTRTEQAAPTAAKTIQGITINVPVGSMDEPTDRVKRIVDAMQDQKNWKMPTAPFVTMDADTASDVAYGLDWFMGGHEMTVNMATGEIEVTSKGYYHYIGA